MRLVIQRVQSASVQVLENPKDKSGRLVGKINKGLFVLVGFGKYDNKNDAELLAEKLLKLRVMSDENHKMNLSTVDIKSSILVVSQFTLYADTSDGNRPSFIEASDPKLANELYVYFIKLLKDKKINIETGEFGAYMQIEAKLDGPVTIIMNSNK